MRKLFFTLFLPLLAATATAQQADWQRVHAMEEEVLDSIYDISNVSASFFEGSHYLYYSQYGRYQIVDALTGRQEPLINDADDFVSQYAHLTGDTTLHADRLRFYGLTLPYGDGRSFTWTARGRQLTFDRTIQRLSIADKPREKRRTGGYDFRNNSMTTTDSLFTMLGDRYNLYVRDNRSGTITQLTHDGVDYGSYCFRSAKDTIMTGQAAGEWHGHIYIDFVQDDSKVGDLYIIDALATPRPKLRTKKMPLPNEEHVRQYRLFWYNADTREGRLLPVSKFKDAEVKLSYAKTGDWLFFTRRSRSVDTLELCKIYLPTGKITSVIQEVSKPHLNINLFNYHIINGGKHIIWWSERTGRGNYYLYDANGRLLNRITHGDNLVADRIERIDTVARQIIFLGHGNEKEAFDPAYTYYYKASLDGRRQLLLTPGNGTHDIVFSKDGKYAIDSYSRMDMPPVYQVVSIDNPKRVFVFAHQTDSLLRCHGWQPPVLVDVPAADGTTHLYGVMYVPSTLDKTKKYPIISNVYPGPQDDQLPRRFTLDDNANQSLAELGFIVINVQPRGSSPLRGRDFYCYGYGNLRDYPVADDKHTIETLAARYPFIDLSRVGIYGHSGGGFMTVTAMLTYPDFYKVGVAASGNHDNNQYIQWWGETYHGLTKPGGIPTNMELAPRLKGKLLLISGDVDDNVPWASTLRMADALIRNNKRFEMMVLPGKDHGVWSPYYVNLIRYYFLENLLQPTTRDVDILHHR